MQEILLQIRYFERELSKSFKKDNFIFLSNRMSFVCHSYVLVCHPYVTRMYSYVFRMSLVCTRMSSVCHSYTHSYVLVCHPCVTRMWFYHEPWSFNATLNVHNLSLIFILTFANTNIKKRFNLCEN